MNEMQNVSTDVQAEGDAPVLVGIDFSEDARAALVWACRFCACMGSRLILLHVVHDPASSPGFYNKTREGKLQPMQSVAETMMADFISQTREMHPDLAALATAEQQFIPGLPPSRIVEVSNLLKVSLIVVGNRGISGIPHMLLGSVAERVVKLASRPVVVVKADIPREADEKELKRQKKRLKKERKWLKKALGLNKGDSADG